MPEITKRDYHKSFLDRRQCRRSAQVAVLLSIDLSLDPEEDVISFLISDIAYFRRRTRNGLPVSTLRS